MTSPAIAAENLSFAYDPNADAQLAGVGLEVAHGEIVCVLGPNGTGKSTLLRCLLGLQRGWTGRVSLDGTSITQLPERERARRIAYVPQHGTTGFPYTIGDVVVMGRTPHLGAFATPSKRDREIARECLDHLGITRLADRPFNLVSGGERQLALIARALAQDAPTLVLDEPTASLDFGNQLRILRVIQDLAGAGRTILMTTHSPDHALQCASRVTLLTGGRVIADGAPIDVITTTNLSTLYGVSVAVAEVSLGDRRHHVCVPVGADL